MAAALSKAKQYEKTQSALLTVAHELFAKKGYAATSTQDIVERAGVTRGALYYHFQSKAGLFQAVFEELRHSSLQMILERIQTVEGDLWQRLVQTGLRAFLETISEQGTQRILYIDGPAILPLHIWRDNVPAVATIQNALEQLAMAGLIEKQSFRTLACLLWGAFLEAALRVTYADDTDATVQEMLRGLEQLIAGLQIKVPPDTRG